MRVRYTPRAFADREEIFAYLDARNPRAAREVKAFIKERIARLAGNPRRSPLIRAFGVHAHWLGRYPYIIYYRIVEDEIWIIHIRHVAREPWRGEQSR
ncbi:MAG: type II toxin-antitoxin system RelE/ParE family toxin [Methyloceanibacter sp.]|uniref:type II toxin-antitoxin system RelE/ParE family toxin n=1 Tax=Methyloceanibacter sp. TaxID=1965321 RepID=UPI003EE1E64F